MRINKFNWILFNFAPILLQYMFLLALGSVDALEQEHSLITKANLIKEKSKRLTSNVVCSRKTLITKVVFSHPFYGIIYAKGYPTECRIAGNGTQLLNFQTDAHKCGVHIIDDGTNYVLDLYLYVQFDPNIQQTKDERIHVKCAPQEILLSGGMGRMAEDETVTSSPNYKAQRGLNRIHVKTMASHQFTESTVADSLDCWMDIMSGRIPYLKTIDGFVDIGEDVTVLIKIRKKDGIDTRLSRCYAHDGTHTLKYDLTDNDGCTLDTMIMPNFKEFHNEGSANKLLHTTFPAFKFPDRANLHLQCTVVVCNTTCPRFHCEDNSNSPPHHLKKRSFVSEDEIKSFTNLIPHQRNRRSKIAIPIGSLTEKGLESSSSTPYHGIMKPSPLSRSPPNILKRRTSSQGPDQPKGRANNVQNGSVLSKVPVSSSVGVAEEFDKNNEPLGPTVMEDIFDEDNTACFTSPPVIIVIIFLFCSFLSCLTFCICMGVRIQVLSKRLTRSENHAGYKISSHGTIGAMGTISRNTLYPYYNFQYGRMVDMGMQKM